MGTDPEKYGHNKGAVALPSCKFVLFSVI